MKRVLRPVAAVIALLVLPVTAGWAQSAGTGTQTVDAMTTLWGKHPGIRSNHAKGVVFDGSFTPSPGAAKLSKATIFSGKTVPVMVRFSDSTGMPVLADGSDAANPHGMAIKFHAADGNSVDLVTNSLAFFPVATGEEFLELLQDLAVSGPDAPKPTKADQFIAAHPSVAKAFGSISTPSSFARETYNGVDAFIFVNAKDKKQAFRFKITPVAGDEHITPAAAAKMAPDFLIEELPRRLAKQTVAFHLMAQLANPGDQTADPSQPWPADRKLVDMGRITLTKPVADNAKAEKELHFLPNRLQPGIEVSDDPLINARVQAYVISFGRRSQ